MSDKEEKTFTRTSEESEVDKRRFAYVMGAASTAMLIGLVTFFSIGMVGAALGVGIGGFVANFEQVTYDDTTTNSPNAQIYPVLGTQAACDNAPQLEASLSGDAELNGQVEFFKDLPLPSGVGFTSGEYARVSIIGESGANPITVTDLDLRLTALESANLTLNDAEIREFGPNNYSAAPADANDSYADSGNGVVDGTGNLDQTPEFGINASEFILPSGGSAVAHQVSFSSISLTNLDLAVNILSQNDPAIGPLNRTVSPTNRTCQSLAQASRSDSFNNATNGTGGSVLAY